MSKTPLNLFFIAALAALPVCTKAEISTRFSGFGSIGALTTNTDELGFRRDFSDPSPSYSDEINFSSLSVLGLQANISLHDSFEFVGQLVLRDQPVQNSDTLIKIAALNWTPSEEIQFRLGRFSQPFYMLSDSRHIGFANLWTMPVQEFYAPVTNNFIDGAELSYKLELGDGFLMSSINGGTTLVSIEDSALGSQTLEIKNVLGINLEYHYGDIQARLSWNKSSGVSRWDEVDAAQAALEQITPLWPGAKDLSERLSLDENELKYVSAGVQYDNGRWLLIGEAGEIHSNSFILPGTRMAYLSLGYHIDLFTPYISYAITNSDEFYLESPPPPQVAPLVETLTENVKQGWDQRGFSVGLRWDFHFNMAFKFQWDYKSMDRQGLGIWFPNKEGIYPDKDVDAQVLSTRWDFIF
ncbi:hypothetical protein [Agaribacterium haliotis]|uniref:hypothetical protein n=1 Tax=Agaribacterium haliotis TaxID=2013869 RepID=UPI000BB59BAD|nr:hypothetical protein [Agaribacterium haliotis]